MWRAPEGAVATVAARLLIQLSWPRRVHCWRNAAPGARANTRTAASTPPRNSSCLHPAGRGRDAGGAAGAYQGSARGHAGAADRRTVADHRAQALIMADARSAWSGPM